MLVSEARSDNFRVIWVTEQVWNKKAYPTYGLQFGNLEISKLAAHQKYLHMLLDVGNLELG